MHLDGDTPGELVHGCSFVLASHAICIALPVDLHVLDVPCLELLHGLLDVLHPTLVSHLLRRDIGVKTSSRSSHLGLVSAGRKS